MIEGQNVSIHENRRVDPRVEEAETQRGLCQACPRGVLDVEDRTASEAEPKRPERLSLERLAAIFGSRKRYERAQRLARRHGLVAATTRLPGPLRAWAEARDLPAVPRQTFREWWRAEGR